MKTLTKARRILLSVAAAMSAGVAFAWTQPTNVVAAANPPQIVVSASDSVPGPSTNATNAVSRAAIVRDGEYTSKEDVSAYVRTFKGALPRNFITKGQARALGWTGGSLEPYAPGKSIGGDRFGNYERRLPSLNGGFYKECDIDTKGRPRGAKRLIFTQRGQRIYYTEDHYRTFREVK